MSGETRILRGGRSPEGFRGDDEGTEQGGFAMGVYLEVSASVCRALVLTPINTQQNLWVKALTYVPHIDSAMSGSL